MVTTIEGIYENGRVELLQRPSGVERARVYVTFIPDGPTQQAEGGNEAVEQWLNFLREGMALGGPPYPTRDELNDRGR